MISNGQPSLAASFCSEWVNGMQLIQTTDLNAVLVISCLIELCCYSVRQTCVLVLVRLIAIKNFSHAVNRD